MNSFQSSNLTSPLATRCLLKHFSSGVRNPLFRGECPPALATRQALRRRFFICPFIVTGPSVSIFPLCTQPTRSCSHPWLQLLPVAHSWCAKRGRGKNTIIGYRSTSWMAVSPWMSLRDLKFKNSCFVHSLWWQWHLYLSSHLILKTQESASRLFLVSLSPPGQNTHQIPSGLCHCLLQLL